MDYEIIKFENDNVELEVNVSPEEETVWLSLSEMCLLFDRDKSVISRHIRNVFKEGELDGNRVIAKNATTASDGKTYMVDYYNLDVIISVGYRVKSQRGVAFRKWANSVLKEYLLKGYALNEGRTLVTKENYLGLVCRVDSLENRMTRIEEKEKHLFVEDLMVMDGEMFDALIVITRIIETAKESIVVVDPYVDIRTLNSFKSKRKDIPLRIVTSQKANLSKIDLEIFSEKYGDVFVEMDETYHDRYLIIDGELFYHIGGSVNYLGKRLSQITLIKDKDILDALKKRLNVS